MLELIHILKQLPKKKKKERNASERKGMALTT